MSLVLSTYVANLSQEIFFVETFSVGTRNLCRHLISKRKIFRLRFGKMTKFRKFREISEELCN